jgi:hypothetical protein
MSITAPFPDAAQMRRRDLFRDAASRKRVIRRRPNQQQGRALEKLGHAVEYLVDSRMALIYEPSTRADAEALDILMRLSRCVFSECEEIIPVGRRLKAWMTGSCRREVCYP